MGLGAKLQKDFKTCLKTSSVKAFSIDGIDCEFTEHELAELTTGKSDRQKLRIVAAKVGLDFEGGCLSIRGVKANSNLVQWDEVKVAAVIKFVSNYTATDADKLRSTLDITAEAYRQKTKTK